MAFVTDANGVSDILCQILVRPPDPSAQETEDSPPSAAPKTVWPDPRQQIPPAPAKSADLDRLMYCVNPEIQYGQYSSFDGGKSAEKILEEKCRHEYLEFVRSCERSRESRNCVLSAAVATQLAIKQAGK
jgi:hypothetical protein